MGAPLVKHRVLMEYAGGEGTDMHTVLFASDFRGDEGEPARRDTLGLDPEVWAEMGEPRTLTVTVEPGDLLNVEPTGS